MSAVSGNNAMSRDPEFAAEFLARHQDKLVFGSDCSCSDGHWVNRHQLEVIASLREDNRVLKEQIGGACASPILSGVDSR